VKRLLALLLATLAIAAGALAANLAVLDRAGASGDDIGRLSPVQAALTTSATAPVTTGGGHHDGSDRNREHDEDDD
jgi:hypothetical protein